MEFLDQFDLQPSLLSEEFGLLRPDLNHSVAGVLPELINHFNIDYQLPSDEEFAGHPIFERKLEERFPSGIDNIVFLICDALGAYHLSELGGLIWDNISTTGTIASSSFPTMTSTVMSSLSYGKHPTQHGMVGYNIYNENLDRIWNGLNLKTLDVEEENEEFVLEQVSMDKLVNGSPLISLVSKENELETTFLTPRDLVRPGLDDLIATGTGRVEYTNPEDAIQQLLQQLSADVDQQVIALYLPYADYAGHLHGPESDEYRRAIRGIEQVVSAVQQHPKVQNGSTAIALTSDHGQSQIDHEISKWMNTNRWQSLRNQGVTLSTSGRVIHAYCEELDIDQAEQVLEKLADGRGLVIDQDTAVELAGGHDSTQIRQRLGRALLLMEDGYLHDIPEYVPYGEDHKLHGQHGSLTLKELYVPVGLFGGQ